jgi:tRNA-Thr(GGU) m(6)t(6)A37 methyltransferase TsaA
MAEGQELTLRPVGRVVQGRPWPPGDDAWEVTAAEIEIEPEWVEALDGLEEFSHIWLVWWPDRFSSAPNSLRVHPERREEIPLVGLFATRSPHRPNAIAMTAVRLLERRGNRLRVEGLDACQGTPVLDIKPYLLRGDLIPEATAAGWLQRLWQIHDTASESVPRGDV